MANMHLQSSWGWCLVMHDIKKQGITLLLRVPKTIVVSISAASSIEDASTGAYHPLLYIYPLILTRVAL
jgi:hypothetical protein